VLTEVMNVMLTPRQLLILQVLINDYIRSAEPVGSRTLSKREDVTFSPATIRNELSDLEELGYLEKTHSSSGRVPSEKGYRFYVDNLMSPSHLPDIDLTSMKSLFHEKIFELEKLIQHSAKILSNLTKYTAIILGPAVNDTKLKHVQIVPLNADTGILLLVTDTGHVEKSTVSIPSYIDPSDIEKIVNIMNDKLKGVSFGEIKTKIYTELAGVFKRHVQEFDKMSEFVSNITDDTKAERVFYAGKTNIMAQPEFQDIGKVRTLLNAIEQEEIIYRLLDLEQPGLKVTIGHENSIQEIQDCSVITASYSVGGQQIGKIAVLGPTRMEYTRVISLLKYTSSDLTRVLTQWYKMSD
jgi:heat-inducible transcriptional repressor